ncbi:response regulator [Spirosoma linguale]|uniref:Response regulator receiver protein n=1 Tax=Spirosoma linguale (strain ATCC 33905 / DSM 74 / LMG 10896 / Claus 1) TaxID=504472 RepID=D2QLY0_SPILD|nr:response regulator receiver protein [Spirosoma linguale DSM 74]
MSHPFPILLVDDDPLIADVLQRASLSNFPEATFIHVSSFEEAKTYIEGLQGKGPKIVLLDIDLQDKVDGLDFLALLRAHPKGRVLPVVMLSANKTPTLVERAYSFGASSFTIKPFSYADWKMYLSNLRTYWYETVTLLDIRHYKEDAAE